MNESAKLSPKGFQKLFSGALDDLRHPPKSQIAFLDGLRTIAILLVINCHFSAAFVLVHGENFYSRLPMVVNGWSGVDLFFVLSGFFIGSQLWKELRKNGTISINRFIVRRGLRIWPLYFFTFACVIVLYWHGAAEKGYGWADLVFLANYFNYGIVLGGWSLCTEEQFYIVTPLLLYLFARKAHPRTVQIWLWAILTTLPVMRTAIWIHHKGSFFAHDPALFTSLYYNFHTHCDGLVIGLIISSVWVARGDVMANLWRSSLTVLAGLVLLVLLRQMQHEVLIFSGLALFYGSLVWFGLASGVRFFESRIFYWASRLSFGMYLNHPYLVDLIVAKVLPRISFLPASSVGSQVLGTMILTAASASIALATFSMVEHPFLNLRTILLARLNQTSPN